MARFGIAVIDTNNNGRELSVLVAVLDPDGTWGSVQEHDDAASSGEERTQESVYAWGQSPPKSKVTIEYAGTPHEVRASRFGSLVFVAAADASDPDALPSRAVER